MKRVIQLFIPLFFVYLALTQNLQLSNFVVGVLAALTVSRIVLAPRLPLNPGIIAIPSGSKSALGTARSAHAITLSPGELVVAIDDDGVMYTHCLNVDDSQRFIDKAQSMRKNLLNKMFE